MPRKLLLSSILMAFVIICITQQVWIFNARATTVSKKLPAPLPITYSVLAMSKVLPVPPGAANVASYKDSAELSGVGYGTTGLDGCLWIDASGVVFGRSARSREERISEIGEWYAKQIVSALPDSYVERAVNLPQNIEANSLHCYYVVRHPAGAIIVAAGYKSTNDGKGISDIVKVQVSSMNNDGDMQVKVGI